jgi:hypothetical protein
MMNFDKLVLFGYLLSAQTEVANAFTLTAKPTTTTRTTTATRTRTTIQQIAIAFQPNRIPITYPPATTSVTTLFSTPPSDGNGNGSEGDSKSDAEGESLAADFFKTLQSRNIQLDEDDFLDEDDDEDEDDDDDNNNEKVQNVEGSDDAVSLSDDQVYSELNERVLETAGGFVDLVGGANDDDDDDEDGLLAKPKVYEPPTLVPDPALTAGEVVTTVLQALNHNDVPTLDKGVDILFGYSSSGSAISHASEVEGMTPAEYALFLKEEYEYKILFNHDEVMIEKGDYSFDKKKAFFTARLNSKDDPSDFTNVNFILSTDGQGEDDCWLIDSLLIRPKGMRRRRRR